MPKNEVFYSFAKYSYATKCSRYRQRHEATNPTVESDTYASDQNGID